MASIIMSPGARKRSPSTHEHSDRDQKVRKLSATGMETQVNAPGIPVAESVPWNIFRSVYRCDFAPNTRPKLTVHSVKEIGEGDWEERQFWNRLRKVLSNKVRHSEHSL
jgi:hypothetical protein